MEAKKKAGEKGKARCSTTDPEATVMKMADGGFRPAYNVQYAADRGSMAIVGVEVIAGGSDMGRLAPMLDQIHGRSDARPGEALADGGFASLDDIEEAQAGGTTAYAPVPEPKDGARDRHEPLPGDKAAVAAWRVRMGTEGTKTDLQGEGGDGGVRQRPGAEPGAAALPGARWRFSQEVYKLWQSEQSREVALWRFSRLKNDEAYQQVPELAEVLQWLQGRKLEKTQAFTRQPAGRRQKTNNHVERLNRELRFDEKARYKWRKRKSIVRFVLLKISRHVPRPKTHQQQPPPPGGG